MRLFPLLLVSLPLSTFAFSTSPLALSNPLLNPPSLSLNNLTTTTGPSDECFNCQLPAFHCQQYGECNAYNGVCICPPGFGGNDCSLPLCGSLAKGDRRYPREGDDCACDDGWSGLNCNVCDTDASCSALIPPDQGSSSPFPLGLPLRSRGFDDGGGDDGGGGGGGGKAPRQAAGVCYKGGFPVKEVHSMCDVTNRKILDMLLGRPPQVTFSCDFSPSSSSSSLSPSSIDSAVADVEPNNNTCGFQFWIGRKESFYCGLSSCSATRSATYEANVTNVRCEKVECSCIPGRMLCGEEGSVNIDDFLAEEIKGPGTFDCTRDKEGGKGECKFKEPAMNQLINDVFGDSYITLRCDAGECLHYSNVPGYERPAKPDNTKVLAASIIAAGFVVIAASLLFWYLGRHQREGRIKLPTSQSGTSLLTSHSPASLQFSSVSYTLDSPSSSSSTTTTTARTNILTSLSGSVQPGQTLAIMGASGAGKTTLLDILARRSKRGRVDGHVWVNGREVDDAVFRDTVGFVDQEDTLMGTLTVYETVLYSARLRLPRAMSEEDVEARVVQTLEELGIWGIRDSRIGESGRRSISGGEKRRVSIACELVTSPSILFLDEPTSGLDSYNAFNVVESLVRLAKEYRRTVVFTIHQPRSNIVKLFDRLVLLAKGRMVYAGKMDECQAYFEGIGRPCPAGFNIADYLIDLTAQSDDSAPTTEVDNNSGNADLGPRLTELVEAYAASDVAKSMQAEIDSARSSPSQPSQNGNGHGHDGDEERLAPLAGFEKATWFTQFTILSGRAFKNLYRNPLLMLTHYAISILVALICSFLFRGVTDDIPGFQNRMGLFFFVLALFGFSCLTSLGVFAGERILFMRERANGYYSPTTYFTAKVLFDVLPLRVVPPFILGAIVYGPVGLVPTVAEFWKCIFVLVLFNLAASSVVFFLSIIISDTGVANLIGSLVMLFNLLFAGLLINRDNVPRGIGWIQHFSFFHAAYEGLLVNEVRYLSLKDHRYGVDIEVPAAAILAIFGFDVQAFWWPDMAILVAYFVGFLALSFAALVLLVKERR